MENTTRLFFVVTISVEILTYEFEDATEKKFETEIIRFFSSLNPKCIFSYLYYLLFFASLGYRTYGDKHVKFKQKATISFFSVASLNL